MWDYALTTLIWGDAERGSESGSESRVRECRKIGSSGQAPHSTLGTPLRVKSREKSNQK